jgi:hypothetical protein
MGRLLETRKWPNLPHIDLDMIGLFAVARIKEAVFAVTGG